MSSCEEREANENYKMKKSCSDRDSNPQLSDYEADALSTRLRRICVKVEFTGDVSGTPTTDAY